MSNYTVSTTVSLQNNTHGISALAEGDIITTLGFYEENDGGGASFTVESAVTSADGYFEHAIGETGLKAVMIIEDGTVNIDQLGAKGDAVIPEEANGFSSTYVNQLYAVNTSSTDNSPFFSSAFRKLNVTKVFLSPDKNYGMKSTVSTSINPNDNLSIIGNGSTIVEISEQEFSLLLITDFLHFSMSDITLIKGTGQNFSAAITVQNVDSAEISETNVKSLCYGINCNGFTKDSTLNVNRCCITSNKYGIFCQKTKKSTISNIIVDGMGSGNGIDFWINNENINISDVYITNAQIAVNFSATSNTRIKNAVVFNIIAENCSRVFNLSHAHNIFVNTVIAQDVSRIATFSNAENIFINSVSARDALGVAGFSNAKNIKISDSVFCSPTDSTTDCAFSHSNGVCSNISFADCVFDFNSKWFKSTNASSVNKKAHIAFSDCLFKLRNSASAESIEPAKIEGGTLDVDFSNCCFNVENYSVPLSGNECIFHFKPASSSCPIHSWNFSKCHFKQDINAPIKSLILIDSQKDAYEKTFVSVRNSVLNGFEQVMHLSDTAYDETDIETVFGNKERYLSYDNLYILHSATASISYRKAEEYGLS